MPILKAIPFLIASSLLLTSCSQITNLFTEVTEETEDLSGLTLPTTSSAVHDIFHVLPSIQDVSDQDIGIYPVGQDYTILNDKGETLFHVSLTLPTVSFVDENQRETAVNEVINLFLESYQQTMDRLSSLYQNELEADRSFFCIPQYSLSYTISGFSSEFVSILFSEIITDSDGSVSRSTQSLTIDLKSGFTVNLSTIFSSGLSQDLLKLVNQKLSECGHTLYSNYESLSASLMEDCWLIIPGGIRLIFSPYEIASADQGFIDIELSYLEIGSSLSTYGRQLLDSVTPAVG